MTCSSGTTICAGVMCIRSGEWKPGQHIPLPWPKDRVLVVGRRWRSIREGQSEEERVAKYLCCPDKLRFVGSVCTKAFLKHKGGGSLPSELYVGATGNVYLYVDWVYSNALTWIADDMDDFMAHGLRRCTFMTVPNSNVLRKKEMRHLVSCENLNDLCTWINRNACSLITLGDQNMMIVSTPAIYSSLEKYYWRRMVGTGRVEGFGRVVVGEKCITVFVDQYLRFYGVAENVINVVADTVMEFVAHGMFRFRWSNVFYGDKKLRRLGNNLVCPAGKIHIRDKMEVIRRSLRRASSRRCQSN
ncbi:tegument protein UL23 [Mandrillus leucophaeus cytomegalovirus]|uniref:Tegument protein UL23 n=1 Tax=Mandrillus leucophaeus cytomegalovirus TaxID=1654930 RepID=A0A0G2UGM6_9BETA|nr:tegument protein UL23 [Mandrillus leucophaeus cytomegalovirus]AKI29795.1 tegument protein UL23 [Mandrillus leucophaeus cytomegalovirus]